MKSVRIDTSRITGRRSFHTAFAEALGFPDFYGRNMNAWIDCMTSLDDPDAGMTNVHVAPGEVLVLALGNVSSFAQKCPELYRALVECVAFVNYRRMVAGEQAVLLLSFCNDQ